MDVLITGGDTELGQAIAEGFRDAGHNVTIAGVHGADLEIAAKELEVAYVVMDNTDAAALEQLRGTLPHHLDTIVNVPAPAVPAGDPRTYTLADHAVAWRQALDSTLLSAVLTVQILGDHLRSGGSIINLVPDNPKDASVESAIKAAVSNWTSGQAAHFGIRGIRVNALAAGRGVEAAYDGVALSAGPVATEITRLALFLTTPAARHITGQTLHVSSGALANFG